MEKLRECEHQGERDRGNGVVCALDTAGCVEIQCWAVVCVVMKLGVL